MENSKSNTNGTISLPNQFLSWDQFKKFKKLRKIILQFDVESNDKGDKTFSLVAYPVYKTKKSWKIGTRIPLENTKDALSQELRLPLSLGNLELDSKQIKSLKESGGKSLIFKAYLYKKNAHAAYTVTDELGQTSVDANPCPPAKPADV